MPSSSRTSSTTARNRAAARYDDTLSQEVDELFQQLAIDVATTPQASITPASEATTSALTPTPTRKVATPRRQRRGSAVSPNPEHGSSSRSTSARRKRFVSTNPLSDSDASASEGDDDHLVLFRALRMDEVCDAGGGGAPRLVNGGSICAPANGVVKPPGAHVQAGSRAHVPSTWVSFTKSRKVASIWAAATAVAAKRPEGFIAMVRVPRPQNSAALNRDGSPTSALATTMSFVCRDGTTATSPNVVDLAGSSRPGREVAPMLREDVHGLGVLGARAAASSKEVLVGTMVPGGVVVSASSVVAVGRVTIGSRDVALPHSKPPMLTVSVHRGRPRVKDQPLEAVLELYHLSGPHTAAIGASLPSSVANGNSVVEGLIAAVGKLKLW